MNRVIIVGGVAGGATAAARIRRLDEQVEIIMLERGEYISFANCGLPYYIGNIITERDDLLLWTATDFMKRYAVQVKTQTNVVAINPQDKTVTVIDQRTKEVSDYSYDKLLLAPGGEPIKPAIVGVDSPGVFSLRSLNDSDRIKAFINNNKPQSAVVVGGGFIGLEMAENLWENGIEVTIVELADQLLTPLDNDMVCDVHNYLRNKGIKILLSNELKSIKENDSGLSIELQNGSLETAMLIMAIGIRPESQLAKEAGLALNQRGGIIVNEKMQTSQPDIYAVGDAVEIKDFVSGNATMVPLAGPANRQARVAADNICGYRASYQGAQASAILKIFAMTVATTGINEKTAKQRGLDYDKVFLWSNSHATYYPGAQALRIKVIFEKNSGLILGAQIVGYAGVDKRCDVLATAIRAKMTARDLLDLELCYAPPYSSAKDPVNMVGYMIENILEGRVNNFHWQDITALQKRSDIVLLDVRDPAEVAKGAIAGFINIPLPDLRQHLDKLDKTKELYVMCYSGMRSYLANRILRQNGFKAYNLSGGYRLYQAINLDLSQR